MNYFILDKCPTENRKYCILDYWPKGTGAYTHRMAEGYAMGDKFPAKAKWLMSKKYPGLQVPDLIANTSGFLVVHENLKNVFVATGVPIEVLPFTLLTKTGRVASRDVFILNALGTFDCLNLEASEIKYSKLTPGEIIRVRKCVLSRKKLESAPDYFRIKEDPYRHVVSHRLVEQIRAVNPSNIYLDPLPQAD